MRTVSDLISHKGNEVWSASPIDTVFDAIAAMAEHEIGALLVMLDDDVVGIISERDYTRKVILQDRSSKLTRVSEIMTSEVIRVTPEDHINDCVSLMKSHHIRHLPVMKDGVVLGMLSLRDLFSEIIDEQAHTIEHLEHYIRGEV